MDRTLERMLQKLSLPIRRQLQAVPASCWEQVQEIRLQQGREPYLVVAGRPMRLGQLLHRPISTEPVQPQQLQESFAALCDYSVHTCLPQLLEGYLTVEGGHRIGIGATAVIQNGRLCSVRQVSSLNLRIAHCIAHPSAAVHRAAGRTAVFPRAVLGVGGRRAGQRKDHPAARAVLLAGRAVEGDNSGRAGRTV